MANLAAINSSSFSARNLAMVRHYLEGKTLIAIARGNGLSTSRVQQIIRRLMRGLERYMSDEGMTDAERNSRGDKPRTYAVFWLKVLGAVEAHKGFCSLNAELPESAEWVEPMKHDQEAARLARVQRHIAWTLRLIRGERFAKIANEVGLSQSTVRKAVRSVLMRLEAEHARLNKDKGGKFLLERYPHIAAEYPSVHREWADQQLISLTSLERQIRKALAQHLIKVPQKETA